MKNNGWFQRLAACLVACVVGSSASASDWYNWRGPLQTGVSPEKGLPSTWSPDPKAADNNLVWKAPYGCRSTPIVMNGRVHVINYTAERDAQGKEKPETIQERVMCFDADNGKVLWEYKFNVFHTDIVTVRLGWTNPAGDPKTGNLYVHGTQGMFYCFDKDGKVLWSRSLSEEFGRITGYGGRVTTPTVAEDLVIIGMNNASWGDQGKGGNRWLAMNKLTGAVVWWAEPGGQPQDSYYSSPAVAVIDGQALLISGSAEGSLHAMKLRTGEKVWSYNFGTSAINCAVVVDGSLVYCGHGEESPDNNIKGRVICVDGSKVKDGKPELVWKKDGIKARYASFILDKGRLFVPDEVGKLHCLDAKTGKSQWKYTYGRSSRGSPVLADGKIYVGEVASRFYILQPGDAGCETLHEQYFTSHDGSDVEVNGSPAVANGRVYFTTSDEIFCIGKKAASPAQEPEPLALPSKAADKAAYLQVIPADIVLASGESAEFKVRAFDAHGNFIKEVKADKWLLPTPPLPPGAKAGPPALEGEVTDGKLVVSKKPAQQGYVTAVVGDLTGKARVRVAPRLPYQQDFDKIPDGAVPGGWVNAQGKFRVATLKDGSKVLAKVNDKASPLVARGNAYIGMPTLTGYTIECDVQGSKRGDDLPDMGVVANRYTLFLAGNIQKLRITSWDALPRIDRTISFAWQPDVWYRLKLTVDTVGGKTIVKGKAWPRDQKEPEAWTVEMTDPRPNTEGAPGLYGYVTGILDPNPGTDVYYDNVRVVDNKK